MQGLLLLFHCCIAPFAVLWMREWEIERGRESEREREEDTTTAYSFPFCCLFCFFCVFVVAGCRGGELEREWGRDRERESE